MNAFLNSDSRIAVLVGYQTKDVYELFANIAKSVPADNNVFLFSYRGLSVETVRDALKRKNVYINYSRQIPAEAYNVPGMIIVMAELLPIKHILGLLEKLPEGSKMRIVTKRLVRNDTKALSGRDDVRYYGPDKGNSIELSCSSKM